MAIARTLTKKAPEPGSKSRSRKGSVSKLQISAPVELVSTTNMISYTSPNLRTYQQSQMGMGSGSPIGSMKSPLSRSSTHSSGSDSDRTPSSATASFFLPNMNDDSAMSPKSPHRNGFVFTGPGSPMLPQSVSPIPPIPPIPQMSSGRSSTSSMGRVKSTSSQRSSQHRRAQQSYSSSNPFAAELHKVSEIAESFGILGGLDQEEEEYMRMRGLRRYAVDDYIEALGLVPEAEVESDDGFSGGWI